MASTSEPGPHMLPEEERRLPEGRARHAGVSLLRRMPVLMREELPTYILNFGDSAQINIIHLFIKWIANCTQTSTLKLIVGDR